MPYVKRNNAGEIIELHKTQISEEEEWLEVTHVDVVSFLQTIDTNNDAKQALTSTDNEMVRVVEDLIGLLMEKQIFVYTELPEAVQAKLNQRAQLRKDMNVLENPINNDESIF